MIMVHMKDITEGKKSQEETKESEERLRSTLASIDDLVFTLDENDIFVGSYNPTVSNLYVIPEEFMGKSLREVLPKELADRLQKIIEEVKVTGKTQQVEYCLPVQGRIAWFNAKLSPRYSLDAIFTGVTCVARDITERKRAEEALRKSQSQLAEAMDLAHLVNWEYDVATGIFTFDDRFYALYGTTAELEGGTRMAADVYAKEFVHPDDQHMVANEVRKAIQAVDPGYVSEVEHRIIRRDGEIRHIVVRFGITKDEHGRTIKTHGANQDITDRKRAEEALNQANKKLNLLSGITRHDINNQLLVLNGFLNLLHKRTSDEALEDFFTKITKASSRISSMIQFTREYEEIGVKAPVWQDCRTLVDNAAKEAPLGRVSLINDLTAGIEVYADPLITKVCYNLMDNAAKHGGKIKILRFSAMNRNGNHIIICEDDGEGIPDDEKEKIFVRGFGKNTGLGLFLSREILSITGITIRETGEPGKGARFEMTVPKGMYR
jgi:PAS domain S-box-containing protein